MAKTARENRMHMMMSEAEIEQVDDWRFRNRIATRSDAVRRLVQNALWVEEPVAELCKHLDGVCSRIEREMLDMARKVSSPDHRRRTRAAKIAMVQEYTFVSEILDQVYVATLRAIRLNNRLAAVAGAGSVRSAKHRGEKAAKEIEDMLDVIATRRAETVASQKRLLAFASCTDEEYSDYFDMSDDERLAFIDRKVVEMGNNK